MNREFKITVRTFCFIIVGLCILTSGVLLVPTRLLIKDHEEMGMSPIPESNIVSFVALIVIIVSLVAMLLVIYFKPKRSFLKKLIWVCVIIHVLFLIIIILYLCFYATPDFLTIFI